MNLALDVSNVNPADEATVRASGCKLLIAKATEGSSYADRDYQAHRQIAHKLGIRFGSYVFLHAKGGGNEAREYLRYAKPGPRDLVIVDAEPGGQDAATAADMAWRVHACAGELEAAGHRPILYASSSYWLQLAAACPQLRRLRVWEAQYPGRFSRWLPGLARLRVRLGRGASVVLWQWTDSYRVGSRRFDASRIFGNLSRL